MRRSSWTVRLEASFMLEMQALPRGDDLGEGVSSDHTPIDIHGEKGWYPGLKIGRKPLLVCKLWSVQGRFAQSGEGSHSHSLGTHSSDVFPLSRPSDPQCVCSFPSVSLTSGSLLNTLTKLSLLAQDIITMNPEKLPTDPFSLMGLKSGVIRFRWRTQEKWAQIRWPALFGVCCSDTMVILGTD